MVGVGCSLRVDYVRGARVEDDVVAFSAAVPVPGVLGADAETEHAAAIFVCETKRHHCKERWCYGGEG